MVSKTPDWADAARSLLQAPVRQRIEEHAADLLSRALNGGRVVGFIGAGASMAYGRVSWRDLVLLNQERVLKETETYLDQHKDKDNAEIKNLQELLKRHKVPATGESQGTDFMQAFQLTEQLQGLLPRNNKTKSFRRAVAELVADDRGHMDAIIRRSLGPDANPSPSLAEANTEAQSKWDALRHRTFLTSLVATAKAKGADKGLCDAAAALLPGADGHTRPYHRFVIGVVLSSVPLALRVELFNTALQAAEAAIKEERTSRLRAEMIPRERDPLRLLLDLWIRRFPTTNYDSEIEELLNTEGFVDASDAGQDEAESPHSPDPMAPASSDLVFDANHTGHLFAFVAQTRLREAEVVHLHGRADREESLIATEADYQRRYLADNNKKSLMEDAMRAAFESSPLLFVGSGLGEDDLVRPLRQFVQNPTIGTGRVAVALLPVEKDENTTEKYAIRNLQRYGVHTIHYGMAEEDSDSKTSKSEWLQKFRNYLGTLRQALKDRQENLSDHTRWTKIPALSLRAPTLIEDVRVTEYPGLSLQGELGLIRAMNLWLKRKRSFATRQKQDQLAAFQHMITGIQDSVIGIFLCAKLLNIADQWAFWRDAWLRLADYEQPGEAMKSWHSLGAERPFRRNHARLPKADRIKEAYKSYKSSSGSEPTNELRQIHRELRQRFDARAYSPTFSALIDAMNAEKSIGHPPSGRRIFLLVSHSGVGKGHFSAALGEPDYLHSFRQAIGVGQFPADLPAAMFSLSFSHEVTSTFDQLTSFLLLEGKKIFQDAFTKTKAKAKALKMDRIGRLETIMKGLSEAQSKVMTKKRLLIVFNRFSVLFDTEGFAKNAQTDRLFDLLVGVASKGAPIDLMLICGDHALPRCFVKGKANDGRPNLLFRHLIPPDMNERRIRELQNQVSRLNVDSSARDNFVHFLQPARAILLAISYFPSVAVAIARRVAIQKSLTIKFQSAAQLPTLFHPKSAFLLRMQIRDALGRNGDPNAGKNVKHSFPILLAGALQLEPDEAGWKKLTAIVSKIPPNGQTDVDEFYLKEALQIIGIQIPPDKKNELGVLAKAIDNRFRSLFAACGNGRFALTLLLACAYHILLPIVEKPDKPGTDAPNDDDMERTFASCIGFLERTERTLAGLPRSRRDDLILERALDAYRLMHTTPGFPLPGGILHLKKGDVAVFNLLETIIWHLAVIGQPVVTDVIAQAPEVAKAASKARGMDSYEIREVVLDALVLLEYRCLVFEIHSSHLGSATSRVEPDGQTRWAVHRLVQRHVFLSLRAPFVDYADSDSFAITMYVSQPNDVPKLSSSAFGRLQGLLGGLTGYPEPGTRPVDGSAWYVSEQTPENLRLRAQLLRAAFGVLRSTLSLSTLLRLDLHESDPVALPERFAPLQRGVLDEHRLMLRWLLHQAVPLGDEIKKLKPDEQVQQPFYADEILWLHNEIATIAMLQGRLADSIAHYNRADEMARRNIEPSPRGALRTRIALNRAYADIGRGRLRLAEAALRRIIEIPDEHRAVRPIAHGMLGLVHHIRGRLSDAEHEYNIALEGSEKEKTTGLIALGRSRAAALISKSKGDMLRSQNEPEKAKDMLAQAYTLALEGSHEDLRQEIVLSQIRLDLKLPYDPSRDSDVRFRQHRQLDAADTYGRVMGIPFLQCEVALLRTVLQLRDGDLKSAASVAGSGLALAAANDLKLRSTWFLIFLSNIYIRRELYREARPLLHAALRLARVTEYHSAHQYGAELSAQLPPGE